MDLIPPLPPRISNGPPLTLDKPIFLGQAILDVSKTLMYGFHYEYVKPKYGNRARLLFTDMDSLFYRIQTEDFYKEITEDVPKWFDTSDYPEGHPAGLPRMNKKVLGMMKDEASGKTIAEFADSGQNLYSFRMHDGKTTKKCKGVKKAVVKTALTLKQGMSFQRNDVPGKI